MKVALFTVLFISYGIFCYGNDSIVYSSVGAIEQELSVESNRDIMNFISKTLSKKVTFEYKKDYYTLLEDFKKGLIDVVYLGPLTYAILKNRFSDYEPIATIMSEDGTPFYRCFLVRAFDTPADLKKIKTIALTSPYSTCGYFGVKMILSKYGLDLDDYKYTFFQSHDKVAEHVLLKEYDAGGIKDSVYKRYEGLLLKIDGYTNYIPQHVIVANKKTLTTRELDLLKEKFTTLKEKDTAGWIIGRYGFYPYLEFNYKKIEDLITTDDYRLFFEKNR